MNQLPSRGFASVAAYHLLATEQAATGNDSEAVAALEQYILNVLPQYLETREHADAIESGQRLMDY